MDKSTKGSAPAVRYVFGPFQLEVRERRLTQDGRSLILQPKVFDTLRLLVENSGHLLTKEDLMAALWPDAVVEESNLTKNIWSIRRVLGDSEGGGRYIETIPRVGYRFVASVQAGISEESRAIASDARSADEASPPEAGPASPRVDHTTIEQPGLTPPTTGARAARAARLLGPPVFLVVGLATILLGASIFLVWRPRARATPQQATVMAPVHTRRSIAVLGLKNLSGRPETDWLATALSAMVTAELAAGEQLRIVPAENVARRRLSPPNGALSAETLSGLRNDLNADDVVLGSYVAILAPGGEQIRVDLLVQDAGSGETIASVSETGTESDLFKLVSAAGQELRSKLGMAGPTAAQAAAVRASLPTRPEAARLYSEGLDRLRRGEASAARDLLVLATRAQPDFSLAHAALSDAWSALGYDERAEDEARKAFDRSEGLSKEERLVIEGRLAQTQKRWNETIRIYRSLWTSFPDDMEYGLRVAQAQIFSGQAKDALATIVSLRKLPPPQGEDPRIDLEEADAAAAVADFPRENAAAVSAVGKAQRLGANMILAQARMREASAADSLGDYLSAKPKYEEAKTLYERAGDRAGAADAVRQLGGLLLGKGDLTGARTLYRQALESFQEIGDKRGEAAALTDTINLDWLQAGNLPLVGRELEQLRQLDEEVGDRAGIAWALNGIGTVAWDQGDLSRSMDLHRQALAISREIGKPNWEAWSLECIGDVLHSKGDLRSARRNYEDAIAINKRIRNESGRARTLNALSALLFDGGDLQQARNAAEEAMSIQAKLGESETRAETALSLADVMIASGRPEEAARLAREAGAQFEKDRVEGNEALAQGSLIQALLALGRTREAEDAAGRARTLLRGAQANETLPARIACTRADAAAGRVKQARREIEGILQKANRIGWVNFQFEARLTLARIDLDSGEAARGKMELQALARDAGASGFGHFMDEARRILGDQTPKPGAR